MSALNSTTVISGQDCRVKRASIGHRIEDILGYTRQEPIKPDATAVLSGSSPAESSSRSLANNRRRRPRTIYSAEQKKHLEEVFAVNMYPDICNREVLADAIGMTEARVQVWFQNRRARHRRQGRCQDDSKTPEPVEQRSSSCEVSPVPSSPAVPAEGGARHSDPASPVAAFGPEDRPAESPKTASPPSPPVASSSCCSGCSPTQMQASPCQYPHFFLPQSSFYPPQPFPVYAAASRGSPYGYTVATLPGRYASAATFDAYPLAQSTPIVSQTDTAGFGGYPTGGLVAIARQ